MTEMRNLNENERSIYNGIESNDAKIGQVLLKIEDGFAIGNVVRDDKHVQIDYLDVNFSQHLVKYIFVREFPTTEEAITFCAQLPEPLQSISPETLKSGYNFIAL